MRYLGGLFLFSLIQPDYFHFVTSVCIKLRMGENIALLLSHFDTIQFH